MGIFSSLVQLRGGDFSNAMNPTTLGAFTPSNPGPLDTVRTAPVVTHTRRFTPPEAERLEILAQQQSEIAQASETAYKALESLEESDTKIVVSNRNYRGKVASLELTRKQSEAKYLSGLNNLRSGYAEAGASLLESRRKSDRRLEVVEARTRQILKGVY